jgi:hypothetical protein
MGGEGGGAEVLDESGLCPQGPVQVQQLAHHLCVCVCVCVCVCACVYTYTYAHRVRWSLFKIEYVTCHETTMGRLD